MRIAEDTIAAVSTPFGEGAIAVLRMDGPRAVEIAGEIFRSRVAAGELQARVQQFGRIMDGTQVIDEVLLSVHREPASYTGNDVVEIQCHGGILVTRRILDLLIARGARIAEPGEFTRRAFLNGKMDLTQAEAVMDLIRAQTDLALRAAAEQMEGRLGRHIAELRAALISILAHVEAHIDFPDEDIDSATGAALMERIDSARAEVGRLLRTADEGRVLREGLRTVIFGEPNAGKSSLLNRLLGYERAIVSHLPGTTRDTLEEVVNLRGIPVRLIDTAGLRPSEDVLENAGIERTRQVLERAGLALQVIDGSVGPSTTLAEAPAAPTILVLNKCDLGVHAAWQDRAGAVRLSCKTGEGFDALTQAIFDTAMRGGANADDYMIAINARHQACLKLAADYLGAAGRAIGEGASPEFIAIELRAALNAVGDVAGRLDAEELLGEIFSTFCIGK
ncbi:MAG: tRNA uridine-5-carboxymethylaminomethyl(34) synthesis GTPase MnmE [Chthoniobacteraceae bacterium]|jgi:tRNA modification GTPase